MSPPMTSARTVATMAAVRCVCLDGERTILKLTSSRESEDGHEARVRTGEREIEARQHQHPNHRVDRHEVLAPAQHVRIEDRLAGELAARLRREEKRLVRFEREDRVAEACHHYSENAVREVADQQPPERGPQR